MHDRHVVIMNAVPASPAFTKSAPNYRSAGLLLVRVVKIIVYRSRDDDSATPNGFYGVQRLVISWNVSISNIATDEIVAHRNQPVA